MNLKNLAESRIVQDDEVCSGKPRIKGTRVAVSDILLSLMEGLSYTEIMRNFRSIQVDDIKAALAYAFCTTDGVKLKLGSGFDGDPQEAGETIAQELINDEANEEFSKALEEQAAIQEEITKEKIAEIQSKKSKKTKEAPKQIEADAEKQPAPMERPYDLLIDISGDKATQVFKDMDAIEQGLDMAMDNYVFEMRRDTQPWLCYSTKAGIEIDQAMRRNLLVTYADNGQIKKAIFEGYLTTDRQHKVFIQRDNGVTCGKAL